MRNAMRRTGSRSSFSNSSSPLTLPSVTSRSESPAPLPDRKGGRTGPLHLVYHGKGKGRTLSIVGATTGRIYSGHALCGLLAPDYPVRLCAIWLCEQPVFDNTVLLVIIVNSAFLAGSPPTGGGPINEVWSHMLELWFTILFTIELSIKVLAMGFAGRQGTYLADGWNRLDCIVVLLGWAPYIFPSLANLSAIRSLRALRPLRTINQLPAAPAGQDAVRFASQAQRRRHSRRLYARALRRARLAALQGRAALALLRPEPAAAARAAPSSRQRRTDRRARTLTADRLCGRAASPTGCRRAGQPRAYGGACGRGAARRG